MSKSRKSLVHPRRRAYTLQSGRCYYCGVPTWEDNPEQFAAQLDLSLNQARLLKCTGEHLTAYSDGGDASRSNIVAACWFCNSRRHRAAKVLDPDSYRKYVRKRKTKGHWHPFRISLSNSGREVQSAVVKFT